MCIYTYWRPHIGAPNLRVLLYAPPAILVLLYGGASIQRVPNIMYGDPLYRASTSNIHNTSPGGTLHDWIRRRNAALADEGEDPKTYLLSKSTVYSHIEAPLCRSISI